MKFKKGWRNQLYIVIFGSDTRAGKLFDIFLLVSIIISVIVVFFDSVESIHYQHGKVLYVAEWFFTVLFTVEYALRILSSPRKWKYIFSFYGIIDFMSIIPTYLSLLFSGTQFLIVIRVLRLLRVFRILKLDRFVGASSYLLTSLRASRHKITVFLSVIMTIVVVMGALMYLVEGPDNGFNNIPRSIYWAIVTLTTVGYGDIAPQTFWGQAIASVIMILGYSIIAVPTGIITAEMTRMRGRSRKLPQCKNCKRQDHDPDAVYCKYCGGKLSENDTGP